MQLNFHISQEHLENGRLRLERWSVFLISAILTLVSVLAFIYYYQNGLGIAYNDARSHLDIGRRVVEGLNPGFAQVGSVWLPLTHLLMGFTIWNDFMWHSGLAGAIQSMVAYVATSVLIYLFLRELGAGLFARYAGVVLFAANTNTLYLQSTAMTEPMFTVLMMAGTYCLLRWYKEEERLIYLIYAAFWVMLSTLVRYDGWFLLFFAVLVTGLYVWKRKGYWTAEGLSVLFATLAGFGILLWLLWNLLIFGDALYFAFGPYSAHAQQTHLDAAGVLPTRGSWYESVRVYLYALAYNCGAWTMVLGLFGAIALWTDRKLSVPARVASIVLLAPFLFNILALYLGHSVVYIQGLSGDTWFNVRYGVLVLPPLAIFVGYLIHRVYHMRWVFAGLIMLTLFFMFTSADAVTIDDARVGSSQKNVTEVSGWLNRHARDEKGFILISAASHDSVIFSSGLPMGKFIHEGAGTYYDAAIKYPDQWARWIVVRTHSDDDSTWRLLKDNPGFIERFELVDHYPFADIYKLKDMYLDHLITEPILDPKVKKKRSEYLDKPGE